jgi:hypothetical protein
MHDVAMRTQYFTGMQYLPVNAHRISLLPWVRRKQLGFKLRTHRVHTIDFQTVFAYTI